MMDFGRWFASQGATTSVPAPTAPPPEDMLPYGLWERGGKLMATCRSCERDYEWYGEAHEFTQDMSYCVGSPRCLP